MPETNSISQIRIWALAWDGPNGASSLDPIIWNPGDQEPISYSAVIPVIIIYDKDKGTMRQRAIRELAYGI